MKKMVFFLALVLAFSTYSQGAKVTEEQKIKQVINQFFESLEKKDAALMQKTTMNEAQIWRRNNHKKPIETDMRFSKDDLPKMHTLPDVKEIALEFEISLGHGIAMAWVPYEFWVEDTFSHCGVDAFTLFEVDGKWKIISVAYTVEKENCKRQIR
ncbi:nuclear transport factor 2 family protein [Ulvibacterium sp.]|uniref:nuclear transport factor 2 family protein n=1 Tax=Ulvibacterium sp. TaxID=2665914 RepID=UPI00260AF1C0|nr:nuclear transport factor 2 family protein [Ulvibacterium sp.]